MRSSIDLEIRPETEAAPATIVDGTVFRINSGNYHVQTEEHGVVICKLRGNLKKELVYSTSGSRAKRVDSAKKRRDTDPIAVGEHVRIDPDLAMIEEILPRRTEIARESPSQRGQHTLVANLDHLFVACAAKEPQPDPWLLDRFLVMAESADITASIVVNKIDLVDSGEEESLRLRMAVYERAGYRIWYVSARENIGIDDLRAELRDKISAFAGPSGVGKSRMINALCPGLDLRVGDIGYITYKGRHTTTSAELIPLEEGKAGWVADTPGLRQLEFWQVDKEDIQYCFPEFKPYLGECRFADCRHLDELGCAICAARDEGKIDERRYRSFVELSTL
ncbi:putative ribosome biogenesis GTPase RsgA [Capsulimonas corticalis]|uniref:Small ribosomal subunit biogenesis GTPase RsgA n=1 Tax=Capsulimonas corticalis TaxID=2219043 RepID=A0A402CZW3_9BACT|nr:ribosome small subunit-dependent GTPase A [Capsulimonas corticalis]BDI33819.1 putative ribosome biogenesis GTPase RsgA [Capsulimonas corticalis]